MFFFSTVWFWYILLSFMLLYVVIIHFNCFMEFCQMNTPYYNLSIHSVHSHSDCFPFFIITNQILQWTSVHACFLVHTWKSFSWLKLHEYVMWQPGWEGSLGENGYMYISVVWLYVTLHTVACQTPVPMGNLQPRILEWIAVPSSRGFSQLRDRTPCLMSTISTTWEAYMRYLEK